MTALRLDAVQRAVRGVKTRLPTIGEDGRGPGTTKSQIVRIRDRHHQIARFVALDFDRERICQIMGMTRMRLDMLCDQTPAFAELITFYQSKDLKAQFETTGDHLTLLERNMIAAELEIADRLAEEPEKLSVSELHKISRDAADRLGYSKHSVNLNVNVTLKERLEGLRRRGAGAPAGAGSGGGDVRAYEPARAAPPLLDLQAEPVQQTSHAVPVEGPKASNAPTPMPSVPNPDAPMSREEVLARHKHELASIYRANERRNPAPVSEGFKRRV